MWLRLEQVGRKDTTSLLSMPVYVVLCIRLHLKKFWVGTKIASQNLINGKMEYSPQKSDLGHKVLGN